MSVNIPQTANDLDTDSIAFECEQIAEQAAVTLSRLADGKRRLRSSGLMQTGLGTAERIAFDIEDLERLFEATNRNMARMMNRG